MALPSVLALQPQPQFLPMHIPGHCACSVCIHYCHIPHIEDPLPIPSHHPLDLSNIIAPLPPYPKHLGSTCELTLDECSSHGGLYGISGSSRYAGPLPFMHLKHSRKTLYVILCSTWSQWSTLRGGSTRSYLLIKHTNVAAEFWTDCNLPIRYLGRSC